MRCLAFTPTAFAACALLGACTSYGPESLSTGATRDDVARSLGAPTGRHAAPGGERVEYARGPFGKHTYMLDFDAQGRLTRWEQVLTESRFDTLRAGMTRAELLAAVGRPSDIRRLPYQQRTLWSYRYDTPFCRWFQVSLDTADRVVETGYGPDPRCEAQLTSPK